MAKLQLADQPQLSGDQSNLTWNGCGMEQQFPNVLIVFFLLVGVAVFVPFAGRGLWRVSRLCLAVPSGVGLSASDAFMPLFPK